MGLREILNLLRHLKRQNSGGSGGKSKKARFYAGFSKKSSGDKVGTKWGQFYSMKNLIKSYLYIPFSP